MEANKAAGDDIVRSEMEFVIPGRNVDLLRQNASRVKRLFNVEFKFSNTFERGNMIMQWINLIGRDSTAEGIDNAKTYIISMTNPDAQITMDKFPPSLYQSSVDDIETETCAYLTQKGDSVVIQGSQLAVVLAQSMLESVQQDSTAEKPSIQENTQKKVVFDEEDSLMEDAAVPNITAVIPLKGSQKTDDSLRVLPSRSSQQQMRSLSASPQQVSPHNSPLVPPVTKTSYGSKVNNLFTVDRRGTRDTDFQDTGHSNDNSVTRKKLENNDYDVVDSASGSDVGIVLQYDYLQKLGYSNHYDIDTIEEGLTRCDMTDVVKPAEFLNILKYISESHKDSSSSSSLHDQQQTSAIKPSNAADTSVSDRPAAKIAKPKSGKLPPSCKNDNVILINSDSEHDGGGENVDEIQAYVISSDEDQPFSKPSEKGKNKKRKKPDTAINLKGESSGARALANIPPVSQLDRRQNQNTTASSTTKKSGLRHIVIDGNNVAMHHGDHKVYSVKGIQICINYFRERGHKVTAFVSGARRYFQPRKAFPIKDKQLLTQLEEEGHLKFTPSRRLVTGRIIASYDDRFVLNLADAEGGIVVSNDQYRDLLYEKSSYQELIENRLLPFMFVGDLFMPPDDPLGRDGPTLEQFLRVGGGGDGDVGVAARGAEAVPSRSRTAAAAAGQEEKGAQNPTKYWQRGNPNGAGNFWQVLSEEEKKEKSKDQTMIYNQRKTNVAFQHKPNVDFQRKPNVDFQRKPNVDFQHRPSVDSLQNAHGLQLRSRSSGGSPAEPPRSEKKTKELFSQLSLMFTEPDQQERLWIVLRNHPHETDLTRLCNYIINALAL